MRKLILTAVALFGLTVTARAAVNSLECDITGTGMCQGGLVTFLGNVRDVVNELVDDHATNKTTIDESRTAIIELIDDHDVDQTALDDLVTQFNALRTDFIAYSSANGTSTAVSYTSGGALTAGDPTASAATLTNSTDLTLSK